MKGVSCEPHVKVEFRNFKQFNIIYTTLVDMNTSSICSNITQEHRICHLLALIIYANIYFICFSLIALASTELV